MKGPHNYYTGKEYKGSNVPVLEEAIEDNGWENNAFMTENQAKANGEDILPGETPTMITRWFPVKPKKGEKRRLGSKKTGRLSSVNFYLFNLEQTTLYVPEEEDDEDDEDDE
jgi:antirestriction protein ArdC